MAPKPRVGRHRIHYYLGSGLGRCRTVTSLTKEPEEKNNAKHGLSEIIPSTWQFLWNGCEAVEKKPDHTPDTLRLLARGLKFLEPQIMANLQNSA